MKNFCSCSIDMLDNDEKQEYFEWYYNINELDNYGDYKIFETEKIYENLARKVAEENYNFIYKQLLDYAHKETPNRSFSTIWQALRFDVEHGDCFAQEDGKLEWKCIELLPVGKYEKGLLWLYSCEVCNCTNNVIGAEIDTVDIETDIVKSFMWSLYRAAERELEEERC